MVSDPRSYAVIPQMQDENFELCHLVKISDITWYKAGVPLWQSSSLLRRGTLVFGDRDFSKPSGPFWILKNAWRADGQRKESEFYELMQKSGGPFESPSSLAKWVAGGDIPLHGGRAITIEGHRAQFGLKVIGNGGLESIDSFWCVVARASQLHQTQAA